MAVLTKSPPAVGVTLQSTVKLPAAPTVTSAPDAMQVSTSSNTEQLIFTELVIFVKLPGVGDP